MAAPKRAVAASGSASLVPLAYQVSTRNGAATEIDTAADLVGRSVRKELGMEGGGSIHGVIVGRRGGRWWTVRWDNTSFFCIFLLPLTAHLPPRRYDDEDVEDLSIDEVQAALALESEISLGAD